MKKILKNTLICVGAISIYFKSVSKIVSRLKKEINSQRRYRNRYELYYNVMLQWTKNSNNNKHIGEYLLELGVAKVAIYGLGSMCDLLYDDIKSYGVEVECFIDMSADSEIEGLDKVPLCNLDGYKKYSSADMIIVTPIYDYEKIELDIRNRKICVPVKSLGDIIYEM